ncbi:MAG: hypothetical protein ACPG4N_11640, partial [Gammaproteobacteria bacterium]
MPTAQFDRKSWNPLPDAQPLVPWCRLWPFLRAALSQDHERSTLDQQALVARLARGELPRRLPRLQASGWSPHAELFLDMDSRLYPFWADIQTLLERLSRLRGNAGLSVLRWHDEPGGAVCRRGPSGRWSHPMPYHAPPAGTPILLLSDLGRYGTPGLHSAWQAQGLRWRRQGLCPWALLPVPRRWWLAEWHGLFRPVALSDKARFPVHGRNPMHWPDSSHEDWRGDAGAHALLGALAGAVHITPDLLRFLRLECPELNADVGSEAAAWLSPLLEIKTWVLMPGSENAQADLREIHAALPRVVRERARDLILMQQMSTGQRASLHAQEWMRLAALEGKQSSAAEEFMRASLARLLSSHSASMSSRMNAWTSVYGKRLPEESWEQNPAAEAMWLA